jgi:Rrf2 family iron-sulfur cluster assembly transcriptional regulator
MCYLARQAGQPQTSGEIAAHAGVNASKMRRLLSMLVKSGLVISTQGASGGFLLGRAPDRIDLQEIYCAIEDRKAFHLDVRGTPHGDDHDSELLNNYFLDLFAEIQVDIEDKMRGISLRRVMERSGIPVNE